MLWTPPKLVKWICDDIKKRGFPPPHRLQAEQLVCHALNISRLDIYLQHDKPSSPEELSFLRELLKKRYKREPVAYITGSCEFWSLNFQVGPGVLIPRHETEILIESALDYLSNQKELKEIKILELGTGSGAIPLALCSERSNLTVVSTDISKEALAYAHQNIKKHFNLLEKKDNRILTVLSDRFSAIKPGSIFDYIISNPPYIPSRDIDNLQMEVAQWEPRQALNGGPDGLEFYQYLMNAAVEYLKPDGYLIFEHGFDQVSPISDLFSSESILSLVEKRKDYSKNDRVMVYRKHKK